ncbi:MAG: DUF5320 domain-containing protein [Acetobacteraceae bacterium]|nr:DUF5320 domain-containing protein [Acetobacteraceae bacterium]
MVRGRDVYGPGFWKGGPGPWGQGWRPGWCRGLGWRAAWSRWPDAEDEAEWLKWRERMLKRELDDVGRRLKELGDGAEPGVGR